MKKKIIIFGSEGQLGSNIKKKLDKKINKIFFFNSKNGNILNLKKIKFIFENYQPDIVINCAAITDVDYCEEKKKSCKLINNTSLKNLSNLCYKFNTLLIHFSSDYIFSSKNKFFFKENDPKKPVNYYGKSKLASEKKIIKSGCNYLIFRISWLFSENKKNFLFFFKNSIENNKNGKIYISNNYSSPTSVRLIIKILNNFLKHKKIKIYKKIFHLTCNGIASWKSIFFYIRKKSSKKKLKIILVDKIPSWKAKRPFCSKLNCNKIKNFLKIKLPHWKDELNYYLKYF